MKILISDHHCGKTNEEYKRYHEFVGIISKDFGRIVQGFPENFKDFCFKCASKQLTLHYLEALLSLLRMELSIYYVSIFLDFFWPTHVIINTVLNVRKNVFPSISYYFHIPKIFLNFFPHTGKNRNRRKSNLLP